jgi:histidinol-phosphate aminotransferase
MTALGAAGAHRTSGSILGLAAAPQNSNTYDTMAKLASNENPHGPSEAVLKAMSDAWKYVNRYMYPDAGIVEAIAESHGVGSENVILGAGSTEILKVVDDTFLPENRKLVGPGPSYENIYLFATNSQAEAFQVPLMANRSYAIDIRKIITVTLQNREDVGLVYICNPNNPTGRIVPKNEIRLLVDSIPEDIPIVIDEAYHHYVDNPQYEESIRYVKEERNVIVTRTFSKMAGLAGMRLGYGIARQDFIERMLPYALYSINAPVKYGAVAALKDKAFENRIRQLNKRIRDKVTQELTAMGWEVIPSDASYFMVNVRRDVDAVGEEFYQKGILVGRKFSPMDTWLRVSVGTEAEMERFVRAFKEILGDKA